MSELEIVQYDRIDGMSVFLNVVEYRTAHLHQEWELIWVVDNTLRISSETEAFIAKPGEFILFPPSTVHEFQAENKPCTCLCLQVSSQFINLDNNYVISSIHPFDFLDNADLVHIKKLLLSVLTYYIKKPSFYQLFCAGNCNIIMYRILGKIPGRVRTRDEARMQSKKNERLNRLIEFVNENYMNRIRLSDFAAKEGLTMNYLSHFVKDCFNRSFQDYVNTVRFHAACKLIATKTVNMTEIFRMAGFSDYRYFANTFKKHCGMLPAEYANQINEGKNVAFITETSINSSEKRLSAEESFLLIEKEMREL